VDWIIKDWPTQWQLPIEKPAMRTSTTQSSKPKDKVEAGSSAKKGSLTDNTRTVAAWTQPSGSSVVPKRSRRTPTAAKTRSRAQTGKKDIAHAAKERAQGATSGVYPSQTVRKPAQEKEACKGRKYEMEDPYITLTEDDAELIADKVQDRSEEVVRIVEAQ
jgi:hypothetical protein